MDLPLAVMLAFVLMLAIAMPCVAREARLDVAEAQRIGLDVRAEGR